MRFVEQNAMFRQAAEAPPLSTRICMPTWRNFTRRPFQCPLYEAQDVLVEMDDVDLICLDMGWGGWFKEGLLRRPLYYDVSRRLIFANPGLKKVRLIRDYDVLIAVCTSYLDLPYINAIERWKDHCKVKVCWIDEVWAAEIPRIKYWHGALSQFDYIFTSLRGSVSALSQAINRPCHWLPGGVDALRFSPFPDPPARVIDVYSIGRRYEAIHREILKAAERGELFYVYDTIPNLGTSHVRDHQQHRGLFANIAKRSRYFMVAAAKMDFPCETRGQVEVGYRYCEGAAAGAVIIGEAPDCEAYRELFGWPEAVIEIQPDGSDIMAILRAIGSDPERMAAISTRNATEALRRHDWLYRWKEMFRVAGIEPTPRMVARERRLKDMADFAANMRH
jgi:Glycosyl transferases group 1